MTPQALAELERTLAALPAEVARLARAGVGRVQQLLATTSELLQLLAHERDLHDLTAPAGGHGYVVAAVELTADLDSTVTRLSAAWAGLHGLLLEHAPR